MADIIRFTNGYLAQPDGTAVRGDLYINSRTGKIVSGQDSFFTDRLNPEQTIDVQGQIVSPGLIDVQINGAYGIDFSELDDSEPGENRYVAGLEHVCKRIVETGTTALVPTIITQKEALYAKLLRLLGPRSKEGSAHILGYHAEGPFLHPERRGMHTETLLLQATDTPPIKSFEKVYGEGLDQDGVKMITAAPDVKGVMECVEPLTKRGVTFSIGHSDADLEQAQEAVHNGARMITHLFK